MTSRLTIETTRVPARDTHGNRVSVERQTVTRHGVSAGTTHRYHYDNSHVNVREDGTLTVLATGQVLWLCTEEAPGAAPSAQAQAPTLKR